MSSDFKKISGSRISFALTIDQKDVDHAKKKVLDDLRKDVSLKGFRKGQAPDEMIIKQFGPERIAFEAFNGAVDKRYQEFVIKNKLQPVASPEVDFSDMKKMPVEMKVEVEVFPEISLGDYKKIKLSSLKIEVKDKEIDETIESFMKEANAGKEVDRKAKKGDLLEIDFAGKDEKGEVIPNTKGEKVALMLGSGQFLPDLEKAYEGMKVGEEKTVKVKFPKDYPAAEMAGKSIPFDIKLHAVKEISATSLDESVIEKMTGKKKKIEEFRKDIAQIVERNKRDQEKRKKIGEYNEKLLKTVKFDLPQSWINREVDMRMHDIKNHPQFKHDPENFWKQIGKKEEDLKKEFAKRAEGDLKVFLSLSEIIKQENVELDKDELRKAELITHNRVSQNGQEGGINMEEELQRTILNMRIDKYLEGLML